MKNKAPGIDNLTSDVMILGGEETSNNKGLDENQLREQAAFRNGYSTVNHLQTINQLIEKCTEFKRPFCIRYLDYEKAFDSK